MRYRIHVRQVSLIAVAQSIVLLGGVIVSAAESPASPAPTAGGAANSADAGSLKRQLEPTDYQDWRQAGGGEQRLGNQLRTHSVCMSKGVLRGRMIVANPLTGELVQMRDLTVHMLQGGNVLARASLDSEGNFEIKGLTPGVYGFVAAGADGFAAFSVHVLGDPAVAQQAQSETSIQQVAFQEVVSQLQIETLVVPPSNFVVLKQLIRSYVPYRVDTLQWQEPADKDVSKDAKAFERAKGPGALSAGPANTYQAVPGTGDAVAATSLRSHAVYLQRDGSMIGRVRRLHPGSGRPLRPRRISIYAMRDGRIVGQVQVEGNGVFTIEGLTPGMYSLAAVSLGTTKTGFEGFAAFSVNVLPNPQAARSAGSVTAIPVAFAQGTGALEIDFSLVDYENLAALRAVAEGRLPGGLPAGPLFQPAPGVGAGPLGPGPGGIGSPGSGGEGVAGEGAGGGTGGGAGGAAGGGGGGTGGGGGGGGAGGAAGGASAGMLPGLMGLGVLGAAAAANNDEQPLSSPFVPQ